MASGLAPNENRDYTPEEHARQAYSTAEIILAFPLTAQSAPLIQPQQLFAFLPVRRVGFNVSAPASMILPESDELTIALPVPHPQRLRDHGQSRGYRYELPSEPRAMQAAGYCVHYCGEADV